MDRYWKAVIAAAGVIVQIAAAAGAANAVPEGWRPWVNVVVAIATAVLVYKVPNAPMDAGRHAAGIAAARSDAGRSQPVLLAGVLAVLLGAAGLLTAVPAAAHRRHQPDRPPAVAVQHPEVQRLTMACDHTVWATIRVEQLDGVQWGPAAGQLVRVEGIGGYGGPTGWHLVGSALLENGGAALQLTGPTPVQVRVLLADGTVSVAAGVPEMPAVPCG